ncbi:universal stress protein [Larkinella bovis]|uniref:Universal stress protein n=1 Tax=Larkinella bovis TaxID=683041 RepID=A0ABW0IDZ7_9BACT
MKKILLLTDFSEASEKAIHFAQKLFDDTAVEFDLLHAYPIEPETMYEVGIRMKEAERLAFRSLQTQLSELTAHFHPPFHAYHLLTVPGNPVDAVEAALEQKAYDFVVVGASGAGFLPVLGSVATGLIRHAKTNVLVVPKNAAIQPLRDVVLATDYATLLDPTCLEPLKELTTRKTARLTALAVVDQPAKTATAEALERYQQQIEPVFDTIFTEPYFLRDEDVDRGIDTYLDTHTVDLLVTVPYRKSLLDAVWNRSLTRRLAYNPRVPLLALYDPEPAERSAPEALHPKAETEKPA